MTLPAFHVEGVFVYLRNDLDGAPLSLLGEMSQLIGKYGSIRTNAPKTALPVLGYRPWATVTRPPLIVEGDFVYLRDDLSGIDADTFAALTKTIAHRHIRADGDLSGAAAVHGYRVFMALAPQEEPLCPA